MAKTSRSPNELLREPRLGRGWSLDRMADQLRRLAFRLGEPEPGVDGKDQPLGARAPPTRAFEALAYFALFDGRARDAIDLCVAGRQVAPPASSVFVALKHAIRT
jgi:hypothetical protein